MPERPGAPLRAVQRGYRVLLGARSLTALLEKEGIPFRVLPGLSSVQYLAARLGRPWQDWKLVSAHGTRCDPVAAVLEGREAFFLTGGELGPGELCQALRDAGLGHLRAVVGEELSYPAERITRGTAAEFAQGTFAPSASCWWRGQAPQGGGLLRDPGRGLPAG